MQQQQQPIQSTHGSMTPADHQRMWIAYQQQNVVDYLRLHQDQACRKQVFRIKTRGPPGPISNHSIFQWRNPYWVDYRPEQSNFFYPRERAQDESQNWGCG